MKYLKIFNEEGDHIEYYGEDLTAYPNVGAYQENVLTSSEYDKIYFYYDDTHSNIESNKRFWVDTAWGWMQDNTLNPLPTEIHSMYTNTNSNTEAEDQIELLCVYFEGYEEFSILVRSYAESDYDYVVVSQLNINRDDFLYEVENNDDDYNTSIIKLRTRGKQISNTTIDAYQLVVFSGCDTNTTNHIWVAYRKDSSVDGGLDMGYLLIPNEPDTFDICGDSFNDYCDGDCGIDCIDEDGDGCTDMDCDGDCAD